MDGVEDKGEDQRQEECGPASQQKVEDGGEGNIPSPDVDISAMRISHSQDRQTGEKIFEISTHTNWLINNITSLHELETEDDEDVEALLYKLGVVHDLLISQVDLIVTK